MMENKKITLQEACDISSWTHNTNISRKGFSPLQLLTGHGVGFPGVNRKPETKDDVKKTDEEAIRDRMKILLNVGEEFRRLDFK